MTSALESNVAAWLRSFPANDVAKRLAELEKQRADLSQQISDLHTALETFRRLSEAFGASSNNDEPLVVLPENVPSGSFPPKRVVALRFLSEFPDMEFSPSQIKTSLIERGEMGPGDNEYHALRVALQKAYKDELVNRPAKGRYKHRPRGFEESG